MVRRQRLGLNLAFFHADLTDFTIGLKDEQSEFEGCDSSDLALIGGSVDSEEFDWDTEGKDSSLGLDRLWALAEVASSLMQAATAVAALLLVGLEDISYLSRTSVA